MKIGELVIWHATTSQRLPAIVRGVNDDGTLRLSVLSDSDEGDIWSGEGAPDTRLVVADAKGDVVGRVGDTWDHLHAAVPHGNPQNTKDGQIAQIEGTESWLTVEETIDIDDRLRVLMERAKRGAK